MPVSIQGDHGRTESQVFEKMCQLLKINKTQATDYYPESKGQIDSPNKTQCVMMKARVDDVLQSWNEHLDLL